MSQAVQHREFQVHLRAGIVDGACARSRRPASPPARRRTAPGAPSPGRIPAYPTSSNRSGGRFSSSTLLPKLRAGQLVDLEAREAVVLPIALDVAVVDVVVAEAAEVEARQGVVAVAVGDAGGVVEPHGRIAERKREAEIEAAVELRHVVAAGVVDVADERPSDSPSRGPRSPASGACRCRRARPCPRRCSPKPDGTFWLTGSVSRPGEIGRRRRQVEPARIVVDQRLVVFADERVALAAALGRAEQVVEVGAVVPVRAAPDRASRIAGSTCGLSSDGRLASGE